MNFLGIGSTVSLSLVVFAEVVCAGLLILGLLSRFAALALVILTAVIVFKANKGDIFGRANLPCYSFLGHLLYCWWVRGNIVWMPQWESESGVGSQEPGAKKERILK